MNKFVGLMKDIQISGYQATGLTLVKDSGKISTIKYNTNAEKFLEMEEVKNSLNQNLQTVIGHCRFPTKGDVKFEENNHPFTYRNTVIVHQGVLSNDEELKKKYKFTPKGQTDSWIIVHLIEYYRQQGKSVIDAIAAAHGELQGSWAVALVNIEEPDKVYLFCNIKDFKVNYYPEEEIFVFSTEWHKLDKLNIEVTSHFDFLEEIKNYRVAEMKVRTNQCLVIGGEKDLELWTLPEPEIETWFGGKKKDKKFGDGWKDKDKDIYDGWVQEDGGWRYVGDEDKLLLENGEDSKVGAIGDKSLTHGKLQEKELAKI